MTWFSTDGFMPHGYCYLWTPELLWTFVISEAVITLAYFSIPFALMFFVSKRKDLRFNWIFKLFSLFIFACGVTHLLGIWTIWYPDYWLDALAKAATAVVSLIAAVMLWPLIPLALKLPSIEQLEKLVVDLELEVAQRKATEAELIRLKSVSDERFRILFESTRDALVIFTPSGICLDGNPSAVEMFECQDVQELLRQNCASVSPTLQPDGRRSDKKAADMIGLAIDKGSHLFKWMHMRKDGSEFPVEILLTRIKLGGETLLVSSGRDITQREQTKQALLEAKLVAEKSTRLKSEFLANMSHEIRTPMNAIIGISELVLNQEVPPKVHSYLGKIREASDNLMTIINNILDLSKIESQCMELEKTCFNLDDIIVNLSNLFLHAAQQKKLAFNFNISPEVPRLLSGDDLRIQQILTNLISNAIKFTEQGTVLLSIALVEKTASANILEFRVEDTGIGISEDDLSKLFQPFGQANGTISRRFGGTGLGLVISQRLLKMMGSELVVGSVPGRGSHFSFRLCFETCSITEDVHRTLKKSSGFGMLSQMLLETGKELAGIRALVAEDNENNQLIIKDILELSGVVVEIANNGAEALSMLENNHFDVVLMDIHMPDMDGIEATEQIRAQSRFADVPVIALTADVTHKEREDCFACGINEMIIKPFLPEILIGTLNRVIKNR